MRVWPALPQSERPPAVIFPPSPSSVAGACAESKSGSQTGQETQNIFGSLLIIRRKFGSFCIFVF